MRFAFAVSGWFLGGFSTFCRNLSAGLRARGHEVVLVVLPYAGCKCDVPGNLFDQWTLVPRGFLPVRAYVRQAAARIDQLHPDVLVLHDSPYAMAALPFIQRRILRTPVLHSVAAEEVELALAYPPWWDRLIAVSDSVAQAVVGRGLGLRMSVCFPGVPLPARPRQPQRPHGQAPLHLVTAGRVVVYQKRLDRVPQIARRLAEAKVNFHWTILGDGDYLPGLRHELKSLGLQEHFSLKGSLGPASVASTFEQADVLVMPSDTEGTPQALLEAMAHGVVPVASRLEGSTAPLIEGRECGFLCAPSAPGEFAAAIARLAGDAALLATMGSNAAATIARDFSLERFAARFLGALEEVRAREIVRPQPLPPTQWLPGAAPYRCLNLFLSLRHRTLGQLKRWMLRKSRKIRTAADGLPADL